VLSDSARAFAGAPESACSYGDAFRTLRHFTDRIFNFWSSWNLCAGLQETSKSAETAMKLCRGLGAIFSQQWILGFHNQKAFGTSNSALSQSQDSLHHTMGCIILVSRYISNSQSAHRWYLSTWSHPLRELRDPPLAGRCGKMMELVDREPTMNTPMHLSQHLNGIPENEQFWLEQVRKRVRKYGTTWPWGSTQLRESPEWKDRVRPNVGKDRVCNLLYDKMRWIWNDIYLPWGLPNIHSP